jgi:phosphoribosylamine---glycine ligase
MSQYKETIVAITDAGGRGAALVDAYSRSPHVDRIIAFPGNDMMRFVSNGKPVETISEIRGQVIKTTSRDAIIEACLERGVTLLDVCQDGAVANGTVNMARSKGLLAVGPTEEAGRIESRKDDCRALGYRVYNGKYQPTFKIYRSQDEAIAYINALSGDNISKYVKAAGLADGKGAIGGRNKQEVIEAIKQMSRFGEAGKKFLLEDFLMNDDGSPGIEFSYYTLCNGSEYKYLGSAEDYKKLEDGDKGPNTGSMGCSFEPQSLTPEIRQLTEQQIIQPMLNGLVEEGRPYTGILYTSGMIIRKHNQERVYLIEQNARWGDPETQVVLPDIENDWFELMMMNARGESLRGVDIRRRGKSRVAVTIASKGYPGDYSNVTGMEISGISEAMKQKDTTIYGAGVRVSNDRYLANGGRLLYVVGEGDTTAQAKAVADNSADLITIKGDNTIRRTDIGDKDIARLRS